MTIRAEAGRWLAVEIEVARGSLYLSVGRRAWHGERLHGGWYVNGERVGR